MAGVLGHLRRIVHDLRPPALDELGLLKAIEQSAPAREGLVVEYDFPSESPELPAAVETAIYRIVQEALTNTARHSGASRVTVKLELDDGVRLRITDDGAGIVPGRSHGVGLRSMRERAEELGGTFELVTGNRSGVTIEAHLPPGQD
jgi:signal transduction histidine kinase